MGSKVRLMVRAIRAARPFHLFLYLAPILFPTALAVAFLLRMSSAQHGAPRDVGCRPCLEHRGTISPSYSPGTSTSDVTADWETL